MYQTRREYIQSFHTSDATRLHSTKPMCFCANDFMSQLTNPSCAIQQFTGSAVTALTNWNRTNSSPVGGFEKNDMNQDNDNDVAQPDHYLPISSTITFEFTSNQPSLGYPVYMRVDVIKPRPGKMLLNTGVHQYMLPGALPGFMNLAADPLNRNRINKDYYQILQTKHCSLIRTSDSPDAITKYMKVHIPFKAKVIHCNLTDQATSGETFGSNVPMADQVWVVISTNIPGGTININAMRDVRFRDNQGSTAV